MKKLGLVLGIIASGIVAGCGTGSMEGFNDGINQFAQGIIVYGQSALGGGGYSGNGTPVQNSPFKLDSATNLGNDGLTLWTSFVYSRLNPATSGDIKVDYWDYQEPKGEYQGTAYFPEDATSYSREYLPDTVLNYLGEQFLVFPFEVKGLEPKTDYYFCISLNLNRDGFTTTYRGQCGKFSTSP